MKKVLLTSTMVIMIFAGTFTPSNIFASKLNNQVILNISLCASGQGNGDFYAEIYGTDNSGILRDYTKQQDSGTIIFQDVASGVYEIAVFKDGFALYKNTNVIINADYQETIVLQQNTLSPKNLSVDSTLLTVQWDAPQLVILDENFEDTVFPPQNWQQVEFTRGDNQLFPYIDTWPSHFAVAPAHHSKSQTAELISPPVDLRQASHFTLSFDYFFKAQYGESANVYISLDSGVTWQAIQSLVPYPTWNTAYINLDNFSGVGGKRSAMFKFTFGFAQGFYDNSALDNIKIYSDTVNPTLYNLYLDNQLTAQLSGNILSYTLPCLPYNEQHQVALTAEYNCGISDTIEYDFNAKYLPVVQQPFLTYNYGDQDVNFQLQAIYPCDTNWQNQGLLYFKIYLDGDSILTLPYQGNVVYAVNNPGIGAHTYCVSAVYDLEYWGYPGQTGESGQICDSVFVAFGKTIPFTENWSSGNFESNNWTVDTNIIISNEIGLPEPSAVFLPPENGQSYQQFLFSDNLLTDRFKVGAVWFDFDFKPEDTISDPNQIFMPEIRNGTGEWNYFEAINTTANNDWESRHYDITNEASNNVAAIGFKVTGTENIPLRNWYVDNIRVYRSCKSPDKLSADYIWNGTFGIKVKWNFTKSSNQNENRGLSGFNIYRKSENMTDYVLYDFVPFTAPGGVAYKDMYPSVVPQTGYFYKICALYTDGNDTLESEFAHSISQPSKDFVYVFVTGQKTIEKESLVTVYPNPAKNRLTISSHVIINMIEIYNNKGEKIASFNNEKTKTLQIDMSRFAAGIYYLKIQMNKNVAVKKIFLK